MPDPKVDFSVEICGNATDGFYATVSPQGENAKRLGFVVWSLDKIASDFPKKATIFLQFVEKSGMSKTNVDGPLKEGVNGRINAKNKTISGIVLNDGVSCYYGLYYEETGAPKELIDPELVVDGNSIALDKFMRARQKELVALLRSEANTGKAPKAKKATKPKGKAKKAKKR